MTNTNTTLNLGNAMSYQRIVGNKSFKALETIVAKYHGEVDLYNELETIAVDAPIGRQWVETGTATISRCRSNGNHVWTTEACKELIELVSAGTEKASEDTMNDMGW